MTLAEGTRTGLRPSITSQCRKSKAKEPFLTTDGNLGQEDTSRENCGSRISPTEIRRPSNKEETKHAHNRSPEPSKSLPEEINQVLNNHGALTSSTQKSTSWEYPTAHPTAQYPEGDDDDPSNYRPRVISHKAATRWEKRWDTEMKNLDGLSISYRLFRS